MDLRIGGNYRTGRHRVAGFTLIELMVVVAVIAILASIALPSYQESIRKGRRGQAKVDLLDVAQRAERHRTVNGSFTSFALATAETRSPRGTGQAYYTISRVDNAANPAVLQLQAVPVAGTSQAQDARCRTLTLNQAGQKGVTGSPAPTMTATECW
ncbi:type IV pilin protein [Luteimonas fraxinea]|uniref:Type IV pilin protein n=2 Tax=Luteimonas fraxinea TaxID=2901869 RepID=A0ABS8UA97_9GAMM|nr:type IV pilin protein [Luteimonas fraxinea]MCD9096114.1 type IV pilin protein [Luteimonas fraxinea]MCD9124703.1 type IV pilin protein [Luteimonas fraxinea]UHH10717.1 type IV pilin protein [Luteimonas fraxinea]